MSELNVPLSPVVLVPDNRPSRARLFHQQLCVVVENLSFQQLHLKNARQCSKDKYRSMQQFQSSSSGSWPRQQHLGHRYRWHWVRSRNFNSKGMHSSWWKKKVATCSIVPANFSLRAIIPVMSFPGWAHSAIRICKIGPTIFHDKTDKLTSEYSCCLPFDPCGPLSWLQGRFCPVCLPHDGNMVRKKWEWNNVDQKLRFFQSRRLSCSCVVWCLDHSPELLSALQSPPCPTLLCSPDRKQRNWESLWSFFICWGF